MLKAEILYTSGRKMTIDNINETETTMNEKIAFIHDDGAITIVQLRNVECLTIWDEKEK